LRKKKIKKILLSAIPEQFINRCATLLFNDAIQKKELTDTIERILSHIPHEYAVIIRLKYIDGLPVKKIASKLAINFKAAESKLFRARKLFAELYTHLNS
jgi:DNA-directed RNA polymerase specialized sigma24 family protein